MRTIIPKTSIVHSHWGVKAELSGYYKQVIGNDQKKEEIEMEYVKIY